MTATGAVGSPLQVIVTQAGVTPRKAKEKARAKEREKVKEKARERVKARAREKAKERRG